MAFSRYITGQVHLSDLAALDDTLLDRALKQTREKAAKTGLEKVPVVWSSHTKDISEFAFVEAFLEKLTRQKDIRLITLAELVRMVEAREIFIKRASI